MKIVITGGHHNSALLVAEALREKGHEVYWLGHKYSMLGDKKPSAEYLEVTQKGLPFFEIKAGKLQKNFHFWLNFLRIPLGFEQSYRILKEIKPDLIFSFGGYLALPVALVGNILRIPIVTHEQTVVSGLANKQIAKVAKKIFLTFPSSVKYFPGEKVVVTGLPLRPEIFYRGKKLFNNKKRTLYFTGGKQGAHVLNLEIFKILPQLLEKFNIIHQCGSNSLFNDFGQANILREELGEKTKDYLVKEYFFEKEIGQVFYSADFVVSRAGAHTVYELMSLEKPAILIPIPWSSNHEQEENAKMLRDLGLAEILPQEDLEKGKLLETVLEFEKNLEKYKLSKPITSPLAAIEKIVEEIEKLKG
ncbi:MAG: UDP-N-acetylglucosamine--N-acetylmuramyl-(pentapeptide) pyrophosphoryl-undecaprenol N-acetylglucosamine transferase [Patescibacteria group bacterium]|nr:UDP-N-acetylglucosamine--N-acetylmuramyl-(pentapeptide) pyrophosphoryl-undecaprenol N-acetylglucosamine transferase [Patescibacteria group bacterium]